MFVLLSTGCEIYVQLSAKIEFLVIRLEFLQALALNSTIK